AQKRQKRQEPERPEKKEAAHISRILATKRARSSAKPAGQTQSGRGTEIGGRVDGFGSIRSNSSAMARRSARPLTRKVLPPEASAISRKSTVSTASRAAG